MKLRRAELLNEQHERRMEALESGEEEEEDEDIDEILQAEFEVGRQQRTTSLKIFILS